MGHKRDELPECLVDQGKTQGGVFDVIADPERVTRPAATGGIASGIFWLFGRIGPRCIPRKESFLLRLFESRRRLVRSR